jgi:arsenate reductase (glutaredoxin)
VKPTVYQYPKCSTCRKALAWLARHGVAYESIDLVKAPPSPAVLARAMKDAGVPVRKLFNTSGESYRAGNFKAKLETMSDAEAIAALAADGKLIKRPLVVGDGLALVGFAEDAWAAALGRR